MKVLKHFVSTICSLINSTPKLCRINERPAKGTFPTLSLEPVDSLVDLLATFRARNFQRQIVEKHGLVQTITKLLELAKLGLIIALDSGARKNDRASDSRME